MRLTVALFTFWDFLKWSVEKNQCGNVGYSIYHSDDNVHCYWNKDDGNLPLLEQFQPSGSIYFIDASCKGGLNAREVCSVEAAARVNPTRQVNVLFPGPVNQNCLQQQSLMGLLSHRNIRLRRIYVDEYSKQTVFSTILEKTIIMEGPYPNLYSLDLLKFLTLSKFGGIYMDLDVMATRPFNDLPKSKNWVTIEDREQRTLSTAIFAASLDNVGRRLISSILRVLTKCMNSSELAIDNFNALREALERLHGPIPFNKSKAGTSFTQNGVVIYDSKFFSPVLCDQSAAYFDSNLEIDVLTKSFTQQLCNGVTFEDPITENSTYVELMSVFCPKVFTYLANNEFREEISNGFVFKIVKGALYFR